VTAFPCRDCPNRSHLRTRRRLVKNVIAEGGCRLIHRGRGVDLTGPRVLCLRQEVAIPGWIRGILRLLRVDQILRLEGPFEPFKIALEEHGASQRGERTEPRHDQPGLFDASLHALQVGHEPVVEIRLV
jgi:hypothetical protein